MLTGHPTLEEAQVVAGRVRGAVEVPFDLAHTTFELECERCVDEVGDPCGMDDLPAQVRSRRALTGQDCRASTTRVTGGTVAPPPGTENVTWTSKVPDRCASTVNRLVARP